MAMLIAPMYSQVKKSKESNQFLNKKLWEKELQFFFLKEEYSKKDDELESLKEEKFKRMLKEQKTAREEDSKKKNSATKILSLKENNSISRKETNNLKAENEALKLESTTNNTAATLLKMKNHIVLNLPTQITNSSSKVKDTIDSNSESDSSNGNQ
jgi:hypothetical protein